MDSSEIFALRKDGRETETDTHRRRERKKDRNESRFFHTGKRIFRGKKIYTDPWDLNIYTLI